jgi:hypothetical protein
MTPGELRSALDTQDVPEHRPGFWDDLAGQMQPDPATSPRAGWLVALSAAAAVVVVAGVAALLIRNVAPLDVASQETGPSTSLATGAASTTDEPASATAVIDTAPAVAADLPPWDRGLLGLAEVPPVLVEEWRRAENQLWCSALYPVDTGVTAATVRRAEFSGGWALAWDTPELRSAFGVAGVGSPAWDDIGTRMPNTVAYRGQIVGYGGEGFDDAATQRLAEFSIPGQLCAYQVWSQLGDEHLLELVDSLRLVDGLESEPIDPEDRPAPTVDRGPAPWATPAVAYPDGWPTAPTETLAFIPTAGVPEGATVRTTTQPVWSLAWDSESGPGHDRLNYPCLSCGRGVVGVTVSSFGTVPDGAPDARWDDGSVGFVLPRVGDPGIPIDRVLYRPPGTDDLVPGAPRLDVYIPQLGVVVSVWSHLGVDSLFELADGLRLADPGL